MAKWILLLCGFLFSWSGLMAGEPDEGGIGGTGVLFDAPDIPEVSDVPRVPDVPDSLDVPDGIDVNVSGASVLSLDALSADTATSTVLSSESVEVEVHTLSPASAGP